MSFRSSKTLISILRRFDHHLNPFVGRQKSAQFEYILAQCLARIVSLPFYSLASDDPNTIQKVLWNGQTNPIGLAPPGADCVILSHSFNCVVEFTRRTGASQWIQEGAQLVRHTDDEVNNRGWDPHETYTVFIVTRISRDTYFHLRGRQHPNYKILLFEVDTILKILETTKLTFSLKNIELLDLFNNLIDRLERCPNINSYRTAINTYISEWSSKALESEKKVFIGLKAYEAMKNIGNMHIGQGEIYRRLYRHPFVLQYMNLLDQQLTPDVIIDSLVEQGLAKCNPSPYDFILNPILPKDFSHRQDIIVKKVTEIWD